MITHDDEGMPPSPGPFAGLKHRAFKCCPGTISRKNVGSIVSSIDYVVTSAGVFKTSGAGHGGYLCSHRNLVKNQAMSPFGESRWPSLVTLARAHLAPGNRERLTNPNWRKRSPQTRRSNGPRSLYWLPGRPADTALTLVLKTPLRTEKPHYAFFVRRPRKCARLRLRKSLNCNRKTSLRMLRRH